MNSVSWSRAWNPLKQEQWNSDKWHGYKNVSIITDQYNLMICIIHVIKLLRYWIISDVLKVIENHGTYTYEFRNWSIDNALSSIVVDDVGGEVHLYTECTQDVTIRDVIKGDVVVTDIKALKLIPCKKSWRYFDSFHEIYWWLVGRIPEQIYNNSGIRIEDGKDRQENIWYDTGWKMRIERK